MCLYSTKLAITLLLCIKLYSEHFYQKEKFLGDTLGFVSGLYSEHL